ncbi:MAG: metallophosphoesterase, partial [Clostridiales Family XIII bacterium]|nr:metallophosphoesterase [Clostridiales Family XIII bacterium]
MHKGNSRTGATIRRVFAMIVALTLAATLLPGTGAFAAAIPDLDLKFDGDLTNAGTSGPAAVTMVGTAEYQTDEQADAAAIRLGYEDYVRLDGAEDPIDYAGSFSIAFWMKLTGRAGGDPVLMGNKNWDSGANPGWCLNSTSAIRVNYRTSEGDRGDINIIDTAETAAWTHIAVTFNMEAGEVKTYANGVCTNVEDTKSLAGNLNGAGPTLLGQAYANSGLYNKGNIYAGYLLRNFIMKQGVLTETDIVALYGVLAPREPFAPTDAVVYPHSVRINKGDRMRFVADVNGTGDPAPEDQAVTWSVAGAHSADTRIEADGNLIIGADETAENLAVTATSRAYEAYSDTAVVSVTTPRDDGGIAFGVVSDVHVGSVTDLTVGNNARAAKAFAFFGDPALQAERLVVDGDLTGVGSLREFAVFRDLRDAKLDIPLLASMGNHDENQWEYFEKATGSLANDVQLINGYHFITVSPGSGAIDPATGRATGRGTGSYAYAAAWLAERIASAEAADPVKPIFVFFHHPMAGTHYLSNEQGASGLTEVLTGHNRVVAFSGHSHGVNNHPLNIWQDGGFTTVNTSATCGGELEKAVNAAGGNIPSGIGESSQGLYVTADAAGNVSIATRDFLNDRWLDTWRFDVTGALPYTTAGRVAQAQAPFFPSEAEIRMTSADMRSVGFEFDSARVAENAVGDMVYYYRYAITNTETNETVKEYKDWSGWFFKDPPAVLRQELLGLEPATAYELRIHAVDAYGKESADFLSKTFATTAVSNTPHGPIDYVLTFDDTLDNAGTEPADVRMFRLAEKPEIYHTTPQYGEGKHGRAIYLMPRGFVDLDGAGAYIDYGQSFSTAFWMNVDYLRDDGEPCLLSNRNEDNSDQKGFTFRKNRRGDENWLILEYNPTSGAYQKLWLTPIALHEWIHVSATFDYENNKVIAYVNGEKAAEAEANLSGGIGGITGDGKNKSTFLGSSPWNYTEEHGGFNGSGSDNGVTDADGQPEGRQTIKFWADDFVMSSCVYTQDEILALMDDATSRPDHCAVSFDTDGGDPVPVTQTVYKGRFASLPVAVAKENHTFGGWYAGAAEFDFGTPITGDIALKAQWIAVDETIPDEDETSPGGVTLGLTGPRAVKTGKDVVYELTAADTKGLNYLSLTVTASGLTLKKLEALNGWRLYSDATATDVEAGLLGQDVLIASDAVPVLRLTFTAGDAGDASVRLSRVKAGGIVTGENGQAGSSWYAVTGVFTAGVAIKADLALDINGDDKEDLLDFILAQYHYRLTSASALWNERVAKADTNGDG